MTHAYGGDLYENFWRPPCGAKVQPTTADVQGDSVSGNLSFINCPDCLLLIVQGFVPWVFEGTKAPPQEWLMGVV